MKNEVEQITIQEIQKRPLIINGIPQNVYVSAQQRDFSVIPVHLRNATKKTYSVLERQALPNGFVEEIVEKDYPINSASVTSYVEASDYRNDPVQAIANAPKRVNLGDISGVQEFVRDNPVQAVGKYADILRRVADYFETQSQQQQTPPVATPTTAKE